MPNKEVLAEISRIVKSQGSRDSKNVYVYFYVPGMNIDGIAYATAHQNPTLNVEIMEAVLPAKFRASIWGGVIGEHRKFDSVQAMIEDWGDFSSQDGSFKILENQPILHIQISPRFLHSLLNETPNADIEFTIDSAIIDTFYRAFIHTEIDELKITALPMSVGGVFEPDRQTEYLSELQKTVFTTKRTALTIAQKYFPVQTVDELLTTEHYDDGTVLEDWIPEFSAMLTDIDSPLLSNFVQEIRATP